MVTLLAARCIHGPAACGMDKLYRKTAPPHDVLGFVIYPAPIRPLQVKLLVSLSIATLFMLLQVTPLKNAARSRRVCRLNHCGVAWWGDWSAISPSHTA
jgi:hypothetical protein